jgi:hypothetical protein
MSNSDTIFRAFGIGLKQARIDRLREEYAFEAETSNRPILHVFLWRVLKSYFRFQNLNAASFFFLALLLTWVALNKGNYPLAGLLIILLFTFEIDHEYNLATRLFEVARKTLLVLTGILLFLQLNYGVPRGSDYVMIQAFSNTEIYVLTLIVAAPALAALLAMIIRVVRNQKPLANLSRVIYLVSGVFLFNQSLLLPYWAGARILLTLAIVVPSITAIALLNIKRKPALA